MIKNCILCKKEFKTWPSLIKKGFGKFCSSSCSAKVTKNALGHKFSMESLKRLSESHIGIQSMENHPMWKGGRRIGGDGYVYIKTFNHPSAPKDRYIREHRLVMEKHLGRFLEAHEQVHHINFNKTDNRIENLMLFSDASTHSKHHQDIRRSYL